MKDLCGRQQDHMFYAKFFKYFSKDKVKLPITLTFKALPNKLLLHVDVLQCSKIFLPQQVTQNFTVKSMIVAAAAGSHFSSVIKIASFKSLSKSPQIVDSKMAFPTDWQLVFGHPLPAKWRPVLADQRIFLRQIESFRQMGILGH